MNTATAKEKLKNEIWVTKEEVEIPFAQLDNDHLVNIIKHLIRVAAMKKDVLYASMSFGPQPSGDAAADCLDASMIELETTTLFQWMKENDIHNEAYGEEPEFVHFWKLWRMARHRRLINLKEINKFIQSVEKLVSLHILHKISEKIDANKYDGPW